MAVRGTAASVLDAAVGVMDMCLLEPLTEDNFIENLERRFKENIIYTYIGNVVVSVNPYKNLPIYTRDMISEYRSRNIYELPPHIYAIADDAYRSMRDRNLDQCVIISGESGSGKTEASKVVMQYVAAVSGKGQEIDRVKEQLLQSNPVLEAFGNAKTNRNDNSSRFGKYMDIEFDYKGDPIGGVITNYLLEKSRVVRQSKGERSFHIFYQLLSGADTSFLKSLKLLRNPDQYYFLRHAGPVHIEGIDDKKDFLATKTAMESIGFEKTEIVALFQLLASVLKLGNVNFQHHSNIDGTDGCRLHNEQEVYEVCQLLSCDTDLLINALCQRTVMTTTERVKTDLSSTEASYARDAICKALYSRLFTWLVARINDSIKVRTRGKRKSMGVLDIYGFEIFDSNSFEQFIINYCNEKLQQIFIELTLKEEQEEYISEGVAWINVEYFNNAIICDLIEKSVVGILPLLDEECLRPGDVSDTTFLQKLTVSCAHHAHFESRGCRKTQSDRTLPHDAFRLKHYAGDVVYRVEGFLDKNSDLLYRDLSSAMFSCRHPLLKTLFPEGNPERTSFKRPATAGSQFKISVNELMRNLLTKCPNYIRCIKPNDYKRPDLFVEEIVRHQVRYLGLMENVRVRRAGYAYRHPHDLFLYRYKMLCKETWPSWHKHPKDGITQLFQALDITPDQYTFGVTKIFIRNPRTLFALEELRQEKMNDLAVLLQTIWRGWHHRQIYLRMKRAEVLIAAQWRGYMARTRYQSMRAAAIVICSYVRGWKARCLLKQLKYEKKCEWAAGVIYKYFRGWQARCLARKLRYERRRLQAVAVIYKYFRGWQARCLIKQLRHEARCLWAVGVIAKYFYGWKVRREYRRKFRAIAGPRIVNFLYCALRYRYLAQLSHSLPSSSPIDKKWPRAPPFLHTTSQLLRQMHHQWRCEKYRRKCDPQTKNRLREKATASDLFLNRKSNYPRSVAHPYTGDYVKLRQNTKWKKIACDTNDQHLVFADIINKVNRKNGKMIPTLLVLSTNSLMVLDQRTLVIKYRIPVLEIDAMSLSPFDDRLVLFHLKKQDNRDTMTKKGDFIVSSDHLFEIVAKLVLLVQNATAHKPSITINTQLKAMMNGRMVDICFKMGVPDVPPGSVKIVRKGSKMDIFES